MNGWQRLGLVASVLIAIGIAGLRYEQFPTQEKIASEHRYNVSFWRDCKAYFQDVETGKFNRNSPCSSYTRKHAELSLQNELEAYSYKLNLLSERKLQWATTTVGYWIGTNIVAFIAIFAALWVYRGFRPNSV